MRALVVLVFVSLALAQVGAQVRIFLHKGVFFFLLAYSFSQGEKAALGAVSAAPSDAVVPRVDAASSARTSASTDDRTASVPTAAPFPIWAVTLLAVLSSCALATAMLLVISRPKGGLMLFGSLAVLALCLLGIGLAIGLPLAAQAASAPVTPSAPVVATAAASSANREVTFSNARIRLVETDLFVTVLDSNGVDMETYPLPSSALSVVQPGWRISGSLTVDPATGVATLGAVTVITQQRSTSVDAGNGLTLVVYRVTIATATNCKGKPCEPACTLQGLRESLDTNTDSVRNFYLVASGGKFNLANIIIENVVLPEPPPSYVHVLGRIRSLRAVPQANFYMMVLPPYFPMVNMPGGAGLGDMPGSSSWYFDCNQRVLVHELLHNLGLHHAGAYTTKGVFDEYADESSVMSRGSLMVFGTSRRPSGWLGLAAPQLSMLKWIDTSKDVLRITANGDYTINSLSSNNGIRAATVDNYWLEWREGINQDMDLQYTQHYFGGLRNKGQVLGSLLIKTVQGTKTILQAMVDPGKKITLGAYTFEQFPTFGTFRVSGLPRADGETVPPQIAPVTVASTTPRPTFAPVDDERDVILPPGRECRASGAVGVCTTAKLCPDGASFSLSGCKVRGTGCCF